MGGLGEREPELTPEQQLRERMLILALKWPGVEGIKEPIELSIRLTRLIITGSDPEPLPSTERTK